MKSLRITLAAFCAAFALWGCQSENVNPKGNENPNAVFSNEGLNRPASICGSSTFSNFQDVNNNPMGSIEVLNTEGQLFILVDMNNGWLLQGVKVFAGNSVDIPKTGNGSLRIEEFEHQFTHARAQDKSTFRIDIADLPPCYSISLYGQAVQLNMFGNVSNVRPMWASGTSVLDGTAFNYCNGVCASVAPVGPAVNN